MAAADWQALTLMLEHRTFFKWQTETLAEVREQKKRRKRNLDRSEKELVRKRDQERCRVCLRRTREVHERLFKSRGGVASLHNSLCTCPGCHSLLQGHAIRPVGPSCNGALTFQMTQATAYLRFRHRPLPPHVEIVGTVERDDEARTCPIP